MQTEHETIEFDILFVGGGPACLAGAIRLMQAAQEQGLELEVALIEKGAEVGSHAVSGAILNPKALQELMPDYREQGFPVDADVKKDAFYYLTREGQRRIAVVPRQMHNEGSHIVSLSKMTRWLGEKAEEMGVNIFPGFAGTEILYSEDGKTVVGVRTGDKGLDKEGNPKGNFEAGYDLLAKITIFGEGARGSLTRELDEKFDIYEGRIPQVYETGIKEVIQLPEDHPFFGMAVNVIHLAGYPLGWDTPGGGFIYEMAEHRIAVGYLTALCYENPRIDPYDEFLKFKQHPFVSKIISGGRIIEQGARTVSTGGYFSVPHLAVNGGMIIGGGAAIHNTPGLKGIHLAMKSGMLAAESCIDALKAERFDRETLEVYPRRFRRSWVKQEMYEGRNFAQALAKKGFAKLIHLGAQHFSGGRGIRDFMPIEPDHTTLKPAAKCSEPEAVDPKTLDGELYADKLTGVYLSHTMHREDQPSHLIVHDRDLCITQCYPEYGCPCTRFCPGKVYEIEADETTGSRRLKLNPSNCLHCKTCEIKDPYRNITWTCPEGGEGPGYTVV